MTATTASKTSPSGAQSYEQAARRYQQALDIFERLGDQVGMATSYSQLGNLEKERDGSISAALTWHVKALEIRLRLASPRP